MSKNKSVDINMEDNNATEQSQLSETQMVNDIKSAFSLVTQENGIAHLIIDVVGESVNTLKGEFAEQITQVIADIKADKSILGIVLCSGKKKLFCCWR
jgi:3-hydroxyacyl-CoA dehydrogenase/enoyl-CoA hydratase/3-hydroxybutyryl-CoA epimerase